MSHSRREKDHAKLYHSLWPATLPWNVLRHRDGHAVLIHLGGLALAPRKWDLALTAIYYERHRWHTREECAEFVHRYDFDLMNWLRARRKHSLTGSIGTWLFGR